MKAKETGVEGAPETLKPQVLRCVKCDTVIEVPPGTRLETPLDKIAIEKKIRERFLQAVGIRRRRGVPLVHEEMEV